MLNKEECEKALDSLRVFSLQNLNANLREVTKSNDVIEQLIKKHFDNQPLKFEELKTDMWVWDNENNSWLKVIGFYGFNIHVQFGIGIHKNDCYVEYVENRFYRKQVGE